MDGAYGLQLIADTPVEALAVALRLQSDCSAWALDGNNVVAGIVLQIPDQPQLQQTGDTAPRFVCVSIGYGTRCVGYEPSAYPFEAELILRDGHAEVMARRGFVAFLLDAAANINRGCAPHPFVEPCRCAVDAGEEWQGMRLRAGAVVHVVCTECPCGAMSIPRGGGHVLLRVPSGRALFSFPDTVAPTSHPHSLAHSNGKENDHVVLCHKHVLAAHKSHAADALLLVGRVKPGRGRPNLCMSCSDKLLRWHCLGIQGWRRAQLFPAPVRLAGIWLPKEENTLGDAGHALNERIRYIAPALREAVKLHSFSMAELKQMLPPAAAPQDGCWSRSAWLTVRMDNDDVAEHIVKSHAGTKRPRGPALEYCALSWVQEASVVLNSKAGLPRGATRQTLRRAAQQLQELRQCDVSGDKLSVGAIDSVADRFPLSRLWMAQRVARGLTRSAGIGQMRSSPAAVAVGGDGDCVVMTGGSVHHWLREAGDGDRSLPLLWVEKGERSLCP